MQKCVTQVVPPQYARAQIIFDVVLAERFQADESLLTLCPDSSVLSVLDIVAPCGKLGIQFVYVFDRGYQRVDSSAYLLFP